MLSKAILIFDDNSKRAMNFLKLILVGGISKNTDLRATAAQIVTAFTLGQTLNF